MKDEDAPTRDTASDPEQAEALSRAARDAVRQPADPRLEASFARLGLFGEETERPPRPGEPVPADPTPNLPPGVPAPASSPRPPTIQIGAAAPAIDLDPLRAQLAVLQATTERLERSFSRATALLAALLAVVAVLVILVLLRV
jgi:hypothetical protein